MTLDPETVRRHYETADVVLYAGDCLDVLRQIPNNSVDSIVTDPPAGIAFMGKEWDEAKGGREQWSAWLADVMREAYRVAKPGVHALVWALPRTSHWTACGIEDAGWVIRDRVHHLFGSGFPKSTSVSKQIDAAATKTAEAVALLKSELRRVFDASGLTLNELNEACGFEASGYLRTSSTWARVFPSSEKWQRIRDVVGCEDHFSFEFQAAERLIVGQARSGLHRGSGTTVAFGIGRDRRLVDVTAPATDAARQWEGWGTALNPSAEDWWLARKPLSEGTVAANVLRWGTGAINVDGCRVGTEARPLRTSDRRSGNSTYGDGLHGSRAVGSTSEGRWPAHTLITHDARCRERCHAECPAAVMDGQSGDRPGFSTQRDLRETPSAYFGADKKPGVREGHNDSGGASRFFPQFRWSPGNDPAPFLYTAKAASAERPRAKRDGAGEGSSGSRTPGSPVEKRVDHVAHPTVKPLEFMRWLARLITPPGGTVLDCFAGSGTTGEAALLEGMRAVLIEREPDYLPLIVQRLTRQRDPVAYAQATGTEGEALW